MEKNNYFVLMSESRNRTSSANFDKFILEMKKFNEQFKTYSVGDMLYSLMREMNKQDKKLLTVTNEEIVELLDKAKVNEKG